jgi:hypothetical protein
VARAGAGAGFDGGVVEGERAGGGIEAIGNDLVGAEIAGEREAPAGSDVDAVRMGGVLL